MDQEVLLYFLVSCLEEEGLFCQREVDHLLEMVLDPSWDPFHGVVVVQTWGQIQDPLVEEDHDDQTLPSLAEGIPLGDQSSLVGVHAAQSPYRQDEVQNVERSRRVEEDRRDHRKALDRVDQSLGGVARHLCMGRGPCHGGALEEGGSRQDGVGACLGPSWAGTFWA